MSKSILIKGADFSQNGFVNPVTIPEVIRGYLIGSEYTGCYLVNTAEVGDNIINEGMYKRPSLDSFSTSAVAKLKINPTYPITDAEVTIKVLGAGCPIFMITDSDGEILFITDQRTAGSPGTIRAYNNIISDIPLNAKYIYYQIDVNSDCAYSFTKVIE